MTAAASADLPIIVVDGNHEVWPSLARYETTEHFLQARESRRPVHLGGALWWAWRGSVWTWSGRRLGSLGGAVSPDKHEPHHRHYRWPFEEAASVDDLERLLDNTDREFGGDIDVLFTHDAPQQVRGLRKNMDGVPLYIEAEADHMRDLLAEAVDRTQPRYVLHGHWHQYNRERISDRTEVIGLNKNRQRVHTAVLRLQPDLCVTETHPPPLA